MAWANTQLSYSNALRLPRERLGRRRALSVTRDDIEALVDYAYSQGRKRGGKPGTGLGERSVRLMRGRHSAVFEQGIEDRRLSFNPSRKVRADAPTADARPRRNRPTWDEGQLRTFLALADTDRLAPVWRLLACGLRREEVAGLAWDGTVELPGGEVRRAVDLDARTITIGPVRVMVGGKAIDKATPKSDYSWRTLPLDDTVTSQLRALRDLQRIEAIEAGRAYQGGLHVVCDELGQAMLPEWITDEFQRIARRAGLPRIRMHDTRASMNTLLEKAGVSENFRAAWMGHTVAVNRSAYLRRPGDLSGVGDTISPILGAA